MGLFVISQIFRVPEHKYRLARTVRVRSYACQRSHGAHIQKSRTLTKRRQRRSARAQSIRTAGECYINPHGCAHKLTASLLLRPSHPSQSSAALVLVLTHRCSPFCEAWWESGAEGHVWSERRAEGQASKVQSTRRLFTARHARSFCAGGEAARVFSNASAICDL